jgi:hypothetical protein
MRIIWKEHPQDTTKNGTSEHVSREVGLAAIGLGFAEEYKYRDFRERLADLTAQQAAKNASKPSPFPAKGWCIVHLGLHLRPYLRSNDGMGGYTDYADGKAARRDRCPEELAVHFESMVTGSTPEAIEAAREKAYQDRMRREAAEKDPANSVAACLARLGAKL